ncbi:hypothetical protein SRABI96_00269 [Peribacillus sp. Bi96]|nr:hypothetical protein [Peribacillus sp. Bi96]CAH0132312.1 hypothetical protein SRABI96_00269 [Peribacillus sp. Bi96]
MEKASYYHKVGCPEKGMGHSDEGTFTVDLKGPMEVNRFLVQLK